MITHREKKVITRNNVTFMHLIFMIVKVVLNETYPALRVAGIVVRELQMSPYRKDNKKNDTTLVYTKNTNRYYNNIIMILYLKKIIMMMYLSPYQETVCTLF